MRERLIAAGATAAVLGLGSLALQRWVAPTRDVAILLVLVWFAVVLAAVLLVLRRNPRPRRAALVTLAAALAGSVAVGWWSGFRETEVNEDVAMALPAAPRESRASHGDGSGAPAPGPVLLLEGEIAGADGHAGTAARR